MISIVCTGQVSVCWGADGAESMSDYGKSGGSPQYHQGEHYVLG
jgi:hypothetical protein